MKMLVRIWDKVETVLAYLLAMGIMVVTTILFLGMPSLLELLVDMILLQ